MARPKKATTAETEERNADTTPKAATSQQEKHAASNVVKPKNTRAPEPTRMATRAKNADQHPGDVVKTRKQKRRTPEEKAEQLRQEAEKIEKQLEEKKAKIQSIASFEKQLDEDDAFEATPVPRKMAIAPKPLRRTETYLYIPPDDEIGNRSDVEMHEGEDEDDEGSGTEWKESESVQGTETPSESLVDTEEEARPKKKAKTIRGASAGKGVVQHDDEVVELTDDEEDKVARTKAEKKTKAMPLRDAIKDARSKLGKKETKGMFVVLSLLITSTIISRSCHVDQAGDIARDDAGDSAPSIKGSK